MKSIFGLLISITFIMLSCNTPIEEVFLPEEDNIENMSSPIKGLDKDYWYNGTAEISKYELQQNRYRDIHDGELVTVFVTEDFLTDKQVKNDNYTNKNTIPILKLNSIRRFTTGIYDYSMMTSVFTRADGSTTEKITLSSQDWCGQTFIQLNKSGKDKYKIQMRSYFENEGDRDLTVSADLLEDEILTRLRIDPSLIPSGSVEILPSLTALRFSHDAMKTQRATITKSSDNGVGKLVIHYPADDRKVIINYSLEAPYVINSLIEESPSAFDKKIRSSHAQLKSQINTAYWSQNSLSDKAKRKELSLNGFGD